MNDIRKKIDDIEAADFNRIDVRLIIEGIIKLTSQMHIGVGEDELRFSPESSILRTSLSLPDMNIVPYIPSSTIKGNLRSISELIAKSLAEKIKNVKYICSDYPKEYCRIEQDEEKFIDPCIVCRIFGGNDLASHILFSDALPNKNTIKMIYSSLKPGIAIDRETQISKDQSLFFIETLHPGAEFEFKMIINNISKNYKKKHLEYNLLRILFKMIKLGITSLGGKKSIGMGRFKMQKATVKELKTKNDFLFPEEVKSIKLEEYFEI